MTHPPQRARTLSAIAAILLLLPTTHAQTPPKNNDQAPPASETLRIDFEQGNDLALYPAIQADKSIEAAIVPRPDGEGHCLRIRNAKPSVYCGVSLRKTFTLAPGMAIELEHRETIEGAAGKYLGIRLIDNARNNFLKTVPFSPDWSATSLPLSDLKSKETGPLTAGTEAAAFNFYGRAEGENKEGTQSVMTVWIDNIRLFANPHLGDAAPDLPRVSYTNPPMFDWPRGKNPTEKLQYSPDPAFPEPQTVTVELDHAFYTPPQPLADAVWYYRHWMGDPAKGAWSPAARIAFNPEVHHYIVPPFPYDKLAASPHPRFTPLALAERTTPTDEEKQALIRLAEKERAAGIPDDPPPFDGGVKWKHRVDWISKVAAPITAKTGGRLRRVAEAALLTGDPQTIAAARELLLKVCDWNPNGGSSMTLNDLHSAALLRGMTWCYDAAWTALTPEERKKVRDNLAIRANQFYAVLNPLHGNESQNHTWNKATIVSLVGLAIAGEQNQAREWLECMLELYACRFLPSMGFQGDNNEGLGYWAYGGGLIAQYTDPLYLIAQVNLYEHPWMRQTGRFALYCAPPGGYTAAFGDTGAEGNHMRKGRIGATLAALIGARARDPYAIWYGGVTQPLDDIRPRPPADLTPSILYRHIGWAVCNTSLVNGHENVMVAMRSGKYFAGHQHADINHFLINAYGDKLAIDGGAYDWYGSPHFNEYSVQTIAHNSILVNGKGQVWKAEGGDGKIAAWFDSPAFGYTIGDASNPRIYEGALKRFDRRLLFIKPGILVVHDLVEAADGPARFDWLLHGHTDKPFPITPADRSFRIERPLATLLGRILAPAGLTMKIERSFDPANLSKRKSTEKIEDPAAVQPEWTMTATPASKNATEEFFAVIQIGRRDALRAPDALFESIDTPNAQGVSIRIGETRHIVLSRKADAPGPLEAEGLQTDGLAATVELNARGSLTRAFMAAGTKIIWNGKVLHTSEKPADWAKDGLPQPNAAPTEDAWAEIDGKRKPMPGFARHMPQGTETTWWTNCDNAKPATARLEIVGWKGPVPPSVLIDAEPLAPENETYTCKLAPGRHCITIDGLGRLDGMKLTTREAQPAAK